MQNGYLFLKNNCEISRLEVDSVLIRLSRKLSLKLKRINTNLIFFLIVPRLSRKSISGCIVLNLVIIFLFIRDVIIENFVSKFLKLVLALKI